MPRRGCPTIQAVAAFKTQGERVNVEIDSRTQIIVETVERVLAQMALKVPMIPS